MSNTDKAMELLPCPFCGNTPVFCASERGFTAYLRVRCGSCTASSGCIDYSIRENDLTDDKDYIPPARRKAQVAKFWNTSAHIEAMQRDCRTCGHLMHFGDMTGGAKCIQETCTNHNQWTPGKFKQLTRGEA